MQTTVSLSAGSSPSAVGVADLNGDGLLDLAVANSQLNLVSVLIQQNGAFDTSLNIAVGARPRDLKLDDLNGDGLSDILVANRDAGSLTVILQDMSTGFSGSPTISTLAAGIAPIAIDIGDLNGDEKNDIVVINETSETVMVFVGNGTGAFSLEFEGPLGTSPSAVDIGDYNGDGLLEFSVVNTQSNNLNVYFQSDNHSLVEAAASPFAVGAGPCCVVIGDVTGDTRSEVVVGNSGAGTLSLFRGP